jgi:hypothetical protein
MWFSRHVMHRNYGVHGLFRSSGVAGVTLRLGVQTDDVRCIVAPVIVVGAGFARPITLYIFMGTEVAERHWHHCFYK